ncbi:MAG: Nif3-like dinuclear metal center hexameric protein [Roseibacillus sp.]|nr:Nif3-like dinuclear metal center hexameric protein [Roseibacillus sp.]|tara:strand:+ start:22694 stop:23449 length:756 start_codon:yes stop_codon:yes gene_type:complete
MAMLDDIVSFLDSELRIKEVPDYPGAMNGLQMEGRQKVEQVAVAVDASLPVVRKAVDSGANLLIVHHGMFWNGSRRVTGATYEKFKLAVDAGLAVYSAHIPLDIHPVIGNNACLASALELEEPKPFFEWKGILLGIRGRFEGSFNQLISRVSDVLGEEPHVCSAGSEDAGIVGIITGGAGSEVVAVRESGIDSFLTGEGPHWSYTEAEELGMNMIYGGHYLTETGGVKAVADLLSERFRLETEFIDHPTGM